MMVDMGKLAGYWTAVMFYEERMPPDETINSMIKREQWKPRKSERKFVDFILLFALFCQFSFRFNAGSWSQKHTKT